MSDRYFVSPAIEGDRAILAGPEAHHLLHVMRAKPGDQVTLFDGSGAEFTAQVDRIRRAEVDLAVLGRQVVDRELPIELTLGVPLPKGERRRWLVEKAVELGVTRIVPLVTSRAQTRPGRQVLTRLDRTVIEASKQCGRNRLMQIGPPQDWPDFVAATANAPLRLLAHPGGNAAAEESAGTAAGAILAVGPEGGFTCHEVETATAAGWEAVRLGPRTLRIETAAILLTAMATRRTCREIR